MTRRKLSSKPETAYEQLTNGEKKLIAIIAKYPQLYEDVSSIVAGRLSEKRLILLKEECYRETDDIPFCVDVWHIEPTAHAHEVARIALSRQHGYSERDFCVEYAREMEELKAPITD